MVTVWGAARAVLVMASLSAAGATSAYADSYGAIAISPRTGATGWAHDYSRRGSAEDEAQGNCDGYANDCQVAIWFKNACGAVARGPDGGWGSGWGNNRRRAEREALNSCSNNSDECEIIRWQCSGAN